VLRSGFICGMVPLGARPELRQRGAVLRHTGTKPRMQPTGRGGPGLRSDAALPDAKLWGRRFVRARP
jgi:hypothetical protein